jgi:protein TonB
MFEHSLIDLDTDLERKQQPRRRWLSLPLAIGLHLVALAAFALGSYWNVGPVPVPSLNVAFIDVALPPPPPPPPSGGGHPRPTIAPGRQPKPAAAPPLEQPKAVPAKPPAPASGPVTPDLPPGPPPSDPGPVSPGPGPGPGPGPNPGPGPGIDDGPGLPLHLTAEMSRPEPLRPIRPLYTEVARRAGLQGTVIVEAVIDEKGRATEIRVLRGLPMGLDRAAVEAIERCPFKPAMMAGRPVKVYFNLTVNFTIQR